MTTAFENPPALAPQIIHAPPTRALRGLRIDTARALLRVAEAKLEHLKETIARGDHRRATIAAEVEALDLAQINVGARRALLDLETF